MKYLNRYAGVLIAAIFIWITFSDISKRQVFYGDALGYYSYLPAFFIHHNLTHIQDTKEIESISAEVRGQIDSWSMHYPINQKGNTIIQYTYGLSLTNLPFFGLGSMASKLTGQAMDGYNKYFESAIRLSSLFYGLGSLWLLYLLISRWSFQKELSIFVINLLLWGTNLFWFTFIQPGLSHVNILFLVILLIYLSDTYWQQPKKTSLIFISLVLGLITVIRPTDLIFILIPIFYGVSNKAQLKDRLSYLKTNFLTILGLGSIFFFLPIIPQLIYWKTMTGQFLFDSYVGQNFNWLKPKVYLGLLGPCNGWLTYTPLGAVALVAVYMPKLKTKTQLLSQILLPIYIYIIYSWWCYNYINGFGSRPMIHVYGLLAISLIAFLSELKGIKQNIAIGLCILLGFVNLNYSYKELRDFLISEDTNHAFNFRTFFKDSLTLKDLVLLDTRIAQPEDLEEHMWSDANIPADTIIQTNEEFIPFEISKVLSAADLEYNYLKVEGKFNLPWVSYSTYAHCLLALSANRDGKQIFWRGIRLNNKLGKSTEEFTTIHDYRPNEWSPAFFYVPISRFKEGDELKIFLYNPNKNLVQVSSLKAFLCSNP